MHRKKIQKNLFQNRKYILPFCIGLLCFMAPAHSTEKELKKGSLAPQKTNATPSPNDTISLKYNLTRSDLNLMKLSFNITLKGDQYKASHKLKSKGLVKVFADTKSTASVEGVIDKSRLAPKLFQITAEKSDKIKTAKLSWNNGKITQTVKPALSAERAKSLQPVLKANLVDPLTGLLFMVMFDDPGKPCNQTIRLFEGRKIFDLNYAYLEESKLSKSDIGAFRGATHVCVIKHNPIAGYSAKKMKKAIEANRAHKVWIARIKSPTSDKSYFVPVRARIMTKFGDIDVSLKKGKINGTKLRKAAIALR